MALRTEDTNPATPDRAVRKVKFGVGALGPDGHQVDDEVPANIWPIDGELAQL